jgi:hypothetical protein
VVIEVVELLVEHRLARLTDVLAKLVEAVIAWSSMTTA